MMVIAAVVGAYLLGAIPFGLVLGRLRGVDIREHGSRNIGATNAGRVLGRKWGYLCLALDILKGFGPALTASLLFNHHAELTTPQSQLVVLAVAVAAVLGHVYPIYLKFKGGKGVATTIGVALGIWPHFTVTILIAVVGYAIGRYTTGKVSIGSLTLAVLFPVAFAVYLLVRGLPFVENWPLQTAAVLLGLMIIVRHRENIRRLLHGEELGTRNQPGSPNT